MAACARTTGCHVGPAPMGKDEGMSMPPGLQTELHPPLRHHLLRVASWVIGILVLASAIVVVAVPLPRPAAGGTCGPGRGSESAIEAFFDPVSIGAGPRP